MKLFRDQQLEVFDLSTEGETACETVVYTRSPLSPHAHSHHMSNMNKHHIKITHAIQERTFHSFIVSVLKCFEFQLTVCHNIITGFMTTMLLQYLTK